MKANELRIGNWVNPDKPYQIDANFFQNVFHDNDVEESIPLTEEWLLRFGFEKIQNPLSITGYSWNKYKTKGIWNYLYLTLKLRGKEQLVFYANLPDGGFRDIQFVHQLQNFYFAMVSQELTIQE